jgi:hypothetical protein
MNYISIHPSCQVLRQGYQSYLCQGSGEYYKDIRNTNTEYGLLPHIFLFIFLFNNFCCWDLYLIGWTVPRSGVVVITNLSTHATPLRSLFDLVSKPVKSIQHLLTGSNHILLHTQHSKYNYQTVIQNLWESYIANRMPHPASLNQ